MSKYITSTGTSPDDKLKRMMAHVLDGAFIGAHRVLQPFIPTSKHTDITTLVLNTSVAKDFDELVDKLFAYVQERDHQILKQVMRQMDNNFPQSSGDKRKDNNEERK